MSADGSKNFAPGWHTTDVTYYKKDLPDINAPAQRLLEQYSGVIPDEIPSHLHKVVSLR